MPPVVLVNMPFSSLRWPNLGPSLLKAALTRRRVESEIVYFNFDLAERLGAEHYAWLADQFAFVLGGERLFAKEYFGRRLPDDDRYYEDVLAAADGGMSEADRGAFEATERSVGPFLDDCLEAVDWAACRVVGFAASFQQTMPSICLARRIKRRHPHVRIVLGGAACEGPMGIELLRQFPELDYVFLGEADLTFVPVVQRLLAGERPELPPGVIGRETLGPNTQPPRPEQVLVRDLDSLPYPDFDDYFARLARSSVRDDVHPTLFFETSRGCWWGQKHHCKFCGLNGGALAYRSKSAGRAVDELAYLVDRHDVHQACSSDNILDHAYFDTFLPMLKRAGLDLAFVYEMKTNLKRSQVEILLEAGLGAAQLGIETFLTSVLKLAGKGATALQNLQTLKWFSEPGIEVKWNLLYGFPGENSKDYAALAELLPSLVHLAPPLAVGRVRLDRFSPYFEAPQQYGMANPRPNRAFRHVYPFDDASLGRLAYYYEYDYADGRNPLDYAGDALEAVQRWQELGDTVTLRQLDRSDGLLILTDTRPDAAAFQHRLLGVEREIYLFCDSGRKLEEIVEHVSEEPLDEAHMRRLLDGWIADRLMVYLDGRYLSLALRAAGD